MTIIRFCDINNHVCAISPPSLISSVLLFRASSYVSNKFLFVFGFKDSVTLRRILPQNYEEAETLVNASKWIASYS